MADAFPSGTPISVKVIGSNVVESPTQRSYNLTYEYQFAHGWALGHIDFIQKGKDIQIERMDVYPLRASLEQANAFTLANKTLVQYLFLALTILLPIFSIITAVVCFYTPIPKRKWLWIIFILFGFVSAKLNWVSGAIRITLLTVLFCSAGYFKPLYGPLTLQIAFPLGAVIFWLRRSKWRSLPVDNIDSGSDGGKG